MGRPFVLPHWLRFGIKVGTENFGLNYDLWRLLFERPHMQYFILQSYPYNNEDNNSAYAAIHNQRNVQGIQVTLGVNGPHVFMEGGPNILEHLEHKMTQVKDQQLKIQF